MYLRVDLCLSIHVAATLFSFLLQNSIPTTTPQFRYNVLQYPAVWCVLAQHAEVRRVLDVSFQSGQQRSRGYTYNRSVYIRLLVNSSFDPLTASEDNSFIFSPSSIEKLLVLSAASFPYYSRFVTKPVSSLQVSHNRPIVFEQQLRITGAHFKAAEDQLQDLRERGIIRQSSSRQWTSPFH